MQKINWGILSAANIAYDQVVPALRRSKQAVVSAIATKSKEKAERFEIPKIYDSYEKLITDPTIDAVYIPLPNSMHKEWAVKAMNEGKHVLLEKPAVLNEVDMLEIIEAAEKNNVVFMEAFMYQFHSQHNKVRELLRSEIIGEYKHVKAHFSWFLNNPKDIRLNSEMGGGAMWDVGCYGMHAITQIVGMKPVKLAMSSYIQPEYNVDLTSSCFMIDGEGRTATISASMELPFIDRYEIIGEKGSIIVDSAFRPDVSVDNRGKVIVNDNNGIIIMYEAIESDQYLNQVEHFQECIINNKKPQYSAENSLEVIRYIEKSYQFLHNQSVFIEI